MTRILTLLAAITSSLIIILAGYVPSTLSPAFLPSIALAQTHPATAEIDGIALKEIPAPQPMAGWKQVPIQGRDEPLVLLNDLHPRIAADAQYQKQGIAGASVRQYLRLEVSERLVKAADLLPEGYSLIILDAYRPLAVQQALFDSFQAIVARDNPNSSEEDILEMTQRYVSLPSSNPERPSPHATGGAVDLSILGPNGLPLEMGTEFDSFEQQAGTAFYNDREDGETLRMNRRLLYTVMTEAGFTNYPEEWWHFDYGNQFWGHISGNDAIYNLAEPVE